MELEQIRIFSAVARTKSYSKAAREMFISHSTTSRAVSALEDELGVRLIDREGNQVLGLTSAGELLYEDGANLLSRAEELKEKIRAAAK